MQSLDSALELLAGRLDSALRGPSSNRRIAVLANPADADDAPDQGGRNRLVLTLVAARSGPRPAPALPPRTGITAGPPPAPLEADVLITANFPGQYLRALGTLTNALHFLNANPVLTDPAGDVSVAMVDPGYADAARVIELAGVKGMPWALFRLRGLDAGA